MAGLYGESNTVADIRQIISTLLAAELGVFVGKNSNRPAIHIEPPNSPPDARGLVCVIQRQPTQIRDDVYFWEVALIAHDRTEGGLLKLDRAAQKMRQRFPIRREITLPYDETEFPQINFSLRFHLDAYPHS